MIGDLLGNLFALAAWALAIGPLVYLAFYFFFPHGVEVRRRDDPSKLSQAELDELERRWQGRPRPDTPSEDRPR